MQQHQNVQSSEQIPVLNVIIEGLKEPDELNGLIEQNAVKHYMELIASYDRRTIKHCIDVAKECSVFTFGGFDVDVKELLTSALLHDLGKVEIPIAIIGKRGSLSDYEYAQVKLHPLYGYQKIVEEGLLPFDIAINILMHHENMDGSGYYGYKGNEIPPASRMIRIADSYVAMRETRSYKTPESRIYSINALLDGKENIYDRDFLEYFVRYKNIGMKKKWLVDEISG